MPPSKRKAQLADLARKKRERKAKAVEDCAEDFRPDDDDPAEDMDVKMEMEDAGDAARRQDYARRQRMNRERLRGIGRQSQALCAWLGTAVPSDAARDAAATAAAKELYAASEESVMAA